MISKRWKNTLLLRDDHQLQPGGREEEEEEGRKKTFLTHINTSITQTESPNRK